MFLCFILHKGIIASFSCDTMTFDNILSNGIKQKAQKLACTYQIQSCRVP